MELRLIELGATKKVDLTLEPKNDDPSDCIDLPSQCFRRIVPLMRTLISTRISSATRTLSLLSSLSDESLLETFLPFDLEFTYGAAIHLTMGSALFPDLVGRQHNYSQEAYSILDDIISKGNRVAEVRKTELTCLETLFDGMIRRRDSNQNNPFPPSVGPEQGQISSAGIESDIRRQDEMAPLPLSSRDHDGDSNVWHDNRLSSYDIASIVDQINYDNTPPFWAVQDREDLDLE